MVITSFYQGSPEVQYLSACFAMVRTNALINNIEKCCSKREEAHARTRAMAALTLNIGCFDVLWRLKFIIHEPIVPNDEISHTEFILKSSKFNVNLILWRQYKRFAYLGQKLFYVNGHYLCTKIHFSFTDLETRSREI